MFRIWERHFLSTERPQIHPIRIKLCIVLVNKIRRLLPVCVGRQNLAVLGFLAGSTSKICRSRRLKKESVNVFLFWVSIICKIWQSQPAKKLATAKIFSDRRTRVIKRRFYYTRKINSYYLTVWVTLPGRTRRNKKWLIIIIIIIIITTISLF